MPCAKISIPFFPLAGHCLGRPPKESIHLGRGRVIKVSRSQVNSRCMADNYCGSMYMYSASVYFVPVQAVPKFSPTFA